MMTAYRHESGEGTYVPSMQQENTVGVGSDQGDTAFVVYLEGLPRHYRGIASKEYFDATSITPATNATDAGSGADDLPSSEFQKLNDARVELIARKYAEGRLSPEQKARLFILRARVKALLPRVSEASLDTLEQLKAERAADHAELAEATLKYGR